MLDPLLPEELLEEEPCCPDVLPADPPLAPPAGGEEEGEEVDDEEDGLLVEVLPPGKGVMGAQATQAVSASMAMPRRVKKIILEPR